MLIGILIAGFVLVFAVSHLVSFYLMGKALTDLEADRDSYRRAAILAMQDATQSQNALQEVLEAVFDAVEAGDERSMKAAKPLRELD